MEVWPNFYLKPPERPKGILFWLQRQAKEWTQTILYVVVLYLLCTTIFSEAYQIPSGSMEPTLQGDKSLFVGDRVITLKWISLFQEFKRGDIIVFVSVEDNKTFIVKRLIGLPGDKIEVKPPKVFVNGKELREFISPEIIDKLIYTDPRMPDVFIPQDINLPEIQEMGKKACWLLHPYLKKPNLKKTDIKVVTAGKYIQRTLSERGSKNPFFNFEPPGIYYFFILQFMHQGRRFLQEAILYRSGDAVTLVYHNECKTSIFGIDSPFIVPKDAYFVMGDNSKNSHDSRRWGYLPRSHVLGKAIMVFWPISHAKILCGEKRKKE